MRTEKIFLLGGGGHAKVVIDALQVAGVAMESICVRDDNEALAGQLVLGLSIDTPALPADMQGAFFHLAIGSARVRRRLWTAALALGARALTIVHPAAIVSASATLNAGAFMAARSVVAPSAVIGNSVIINHGAIIDHDCVVGDFSHVAPNATIGGEARIGSNVLIGAGANILPGIEIADGATIGAGSVVTSDVGADEVWFGVPAVKRV